MPGFLRLSNVRIYDMCNEDDDYGDEYTWWDEYETFLEEQLDD